MEAGLTRTIVTITVRLACCLLLTACSSDMAAPPSANRGIQMNFGPEISIGKVEANPSTPFLRYAPDGRLFAVWAEDHDTPWPQGKASAGHHRMSGDRAPSPMRNAFVAWSTDGGKSWSPSKRVNSEAEAVQGEENGPKVAFGTNNRASVVWSTREPKAIRRAPIFASPWRTARVDLRRCEP